LRLRPLRLDDEAAFVVAHRAMEADGFSFGLGYTPGMPWPSYLDALDAYRRGVDLPAGWVPATFLVADVGGEIVGRTSIRHELNEFLAREGGHIGYGVVAQAPLLDRLTGRSGFVSGTGSLLFPASSKPRGQNDGVTRS